MDLSIIIPAYNTEKYIKQCLLSICEQNYNPEKFEIIVVNDDSPDNLESVVKELQKIYVNIKYIKQKNGRQGKARNTGIYEAKGRYIAFVDSDDCWLNTETISTFLSLADKYKLDIISSSQYIYFTHNSQLTTHNVEIYDRNEYIGRKIKHFSVWLSFYRNNIVKETVFREGVFFEDLDYVYRIIWAVGKNGKIGVINFPFYGYRSNPFSTTNKHSFKSFIDNCKA